ncbi:MAG: methyltransferase domain-containing protein [Rhizobiaceae bacterium]|nr:methyltransferase domain-containing protein [Rhizobiaceae bacterium]
MADDTLHKVYMPVVVGEIARLKPDTILDLPSGNGWLRRASGSAARFDGVDLFEGRPDGYTDFWQADLDEALPITSETYDLIVSCEGVEHLGNPLLFLRECLRGLRPGGTLIVTTPNIWAPSSKLKFLLRGFFPGFPSLVGRIERGTHMHVSPFSFPWLYLYLRLAGFEAIRLRETAARKPRHFWERLIGWPQAAYCRRKARKAGTDEERVYWRDAASDEAVYGRAMVVVARSPADQPASAARTLSMM